MQTDSPGLTRFLESQGHAVVTTGGDLRARFVVHAVGPIYDRKGPNPWSHEECDEKLRLTYLRALYKADEVGVQHLAFCLLSAGVFRGRRRLEDVLAIGMNAVIAALGQCKSLNEVHLVGYNPNEISILKSLAESVARGEPIAPSPSTTRRSARP